MKKLNNHRGESLVEALVALLILTLLMTMLPMAIVMAGKVNKKAEDLPTFCSMNTGDDNKTEIKVLFSDSEHENQEMQGITVYESEGFYFYEKTKD